ncbi:molybdopterin-binding oxidoreductase [Actinoplanes sp. ATCC 53533]|uniref:molybdopterin-dependent oxidoreductase n=1 Tax=Actinoplanes sp. ATCC 53533 TaxID=1288362 RepID=UPI000F7916DA|nr:molybdopterin-dependent oxidoreductase [Actinoplanes sp. ATCC 53533]RSM51199.1 molybdopterin-binding oxidoreductase [Actinoplanes sp. ATCC 53533]
MKLSLRAALAGLAAAGVALGVAEIVAVLTGPLSSPLFAVGGVVVDNVPAPVKDAGIAVFGTHDKTALLTGTAVLLAGYAALLGVLALRSRVVAPAGIALFAVIGVAAALTRNDAGLTAALPTLAGAVAAYLALRYLLRTALAGEGGDLKGSEPEAVQPGMYREGGRRRFLIGLGAASGVAAVGGVGGRLLTSRRAVTAARAAVVLPPAPPAAPIPAGAQVDGAAAYVTSNADFYRIDTALYPPQIDPSTWELRIHGMVRNPITITWEQLLRRPMVQRYVTLACVSNEVGGDLIGNALWLGTPIKDLLDEAQPLPGADQVVQRSSDGWTCGSPTAVLTDGRDALLAVGMNGEPLPVRHGFPVRMVVPGLYGYVSACKWITEIELTRFADFDAYWVPRGWSALGPIKTESRIDTPRDGAERKAGPVTVAGVAWAQHRGITKVEVQVDDGPWAPATLAPVVSVDTWVQWSYAWPATAGEHTLRVRATDKDGQTQTSTPAAPAPDGATGWHSVQVTVG